MPNWCTTNYVLKGKREDLQRFCDTVNACYARPDVQVNGFGKLWLANLYVAFGGKKENINSVRGLRGVLDPDFESIPCFSGPDFIGEDGDRLAVEILPGGDAKIAFSVHTAWGISEWFNEMLAEQFPDVEVGWKATDEFGNFHVVHHKSLVGVSRYELEVENEDTVEYENGDEGKIADELSEILGQTVTEEMVKTHDDDFYEMLCNTSKNTGYVNLIVWEDA